MARPLAWNAIPAAWRMDAPEEPWRCEYCEDPDCDGDPADCRGELPDVDGDPIDPAPAPVAYLATLPEATRWLA